MGRKTRSFVVIGLGAFGSVVTQVLARFGNHVLGADKDQRRVAALAEQLPLTVILDATDAGALREAGVDRYDFGRMVSSWQSCSSAVSAPDARLLSGDTDGAAGAASRRSGPSWLIVCLASERTQTLHLCPRIRGSVRTLQIPRPRSSAAGKAPDQAYWNQPMPVAAAAEPRRKST